MKQFDLNAFDDFNGGKIARRVLLDDAVVRVVLVSIPAGQRLPDHSAPGLVTICCLSGNVTFSEAGASCQLIPGKLIRVLPGGEHSVLASEDSRLLVTLVKPSDAAAWTALTPRGQEIDLRNTPHPRRHGIIFSAFDTLALGESFILVNDHDPQPLRVQMDLLRAGELNWEYVLKAPENFRVRISRVAPPRAATSETFVVTDAHD